MNPNIKLRIHVKTRGWDARRREKNSQSFLCQLLNTKISLFFLNFEITIYIQQTSPIFSNSRTDVSFWRTSRMGTVYKEGELKATPRSFTQAC